MNLAKKTVITNTAKQALGVSAQNVEDVICELHKNDNDRFAIGDVKLTTRTINDPNWALCNGALAPDAILDDAVLAGNFSTVDFTASNSNIGHIYDDGDTILVFYKDTLTASTTSGSRFISVDVFTKTSSGIISLSATKSIYTGTTSRSVTQIGRVVKCGGYYHLLYGVQNNSGSSTVSKQTLYISYVSETNPTATWTSVEIANTTSTPAYFTPAAFYTNGTKLRIDASTTNSTTSPITSYEFSPKGVSISSSSVGNYGGRITLWNRNQGYKTLNLNNTYAILNGMAQFSPIYKSSFTGSWQALSTPQAGTSWITAFYFNDLYWAVIHTNSSASSDVITVIAATTFAGLYGSASGLTYNFALPNANTTNQEIAAQVTQNYALIYYTNSSDGLGVLSIDTDNQTHYSAPNVSATATMYNSAYGNKPMYIISTNASADCSALSGGVPNIQVTGTSAYIKIADN